MAPLSGTSAPFLPETAARSPGKFDFTADTGSAVFVMDSTGFASGTERVFAIMVTNSKSASDCKTVTLTASGDITQTVVLSAPSFGRALVDGEADGDACPLKVYEPGFLTKIVSSDQQLAEKVATITVTLRSNVELKSEPNGFKSKITLSGLTGSKTDDSDSTANVLKAGTGNVATAFSPNFDDVSWTRSTGTLVLGLTAGQCTYPSGKDAKSTVQTCMKEGVQYVFQFTLTNGDAAQAAPPVSIQAAYDKVGTLSAMQAVDAPLDSGCLLDQALKIVPKDQVLCSYKIGQMVTTPGAVNPVCVTLKPRKALVTTESGPVAFTVTGLKGMRTDEDVYPDSTQSVLIRDTGGEVPVNTADRLGNTVAAYNKFCKASVTSTTTTGCKTGDANAIKFSEVSGEAEFYLSGTQTLAAGTSYKFCFQLINPSKASACKTDVSLKVTDSDMLQSSPVALPMKVATGDSCVGLTVDRAITANIRSSTNVTGMEAGLFVEMSSNFEIKAGAVITIAGLDNYATKAGDYAVEVVRNGIRDRVTFCKTKDGSVFCEATWSGAGQLTLTVKAGQKVEAMNSYSNKGTTALTFGQTPEEDDVYEVYFVLKNAAEVRSAKPISIATEGFKANNLVNSGVTKSRRSLPAGTARRANGAMTFSFTPKETVSGGESIILELPHYSIDVEGPVFGITSSHAAFTTYAARKDWEVYGVRMDKARAVFTNGYVASGVSALKRSQENSGLDGFFMLATKDDGIEENKNNWFTETTLWEGTLRYEDSALAPTRYTAADADRGKYSIYSTTSWKGSQTTANPNNNIAVDDLVGMRLTCSAAITATYTPDVFGSTHYVTESAYILENSVGGYMIVVESMFSAARFSTHNTEDTVLNAQCRIEYKPTVAKYTGMTVMFDHGKEFTMKQGAGALYQVTDGSGEPPSAHDIEGRAYTIYSQLEITAAQGETVAAGETVTITIDASAGISAPADLTAPVVASQADSGKCTHNIVPNIGSNVELTANNDLDTADTMTVVRKCNYDGMPSGDLSIAAKSTIRRVFASALGRSSSNEVSSTARLSQLPPYKYDASETGPHLLGKPMDVYGATNLLATTMLATAEDKPGVTLSTALDMTTRTDWTREATYAGKAFVIGQENSGMAAPLDISATQRVIAVADATQISVGDYLNVGDEMMLVETVDGNYIGVVRGAAGTTAASHKSLGPSTANDDNKQYLTAAATANGAGDRTAGSVDAVPAHGWVTIWKRTTKSVFVNAATEAKADITPNVAPNFGTANANLGDSDKGYLLLAGGTSSKEFLGDAAPDNAVIDIDTSSTVASSTKPYFATNANAYEKGDSLVLHTCDWDDNIAATAWQTMSGVSGRDNKCKQTTLLGLPVLDAAGIQPKDYLRVNFPKDIDNDLVVDRTEEELYRVNAVINNDVVVTHNPLALATGDAANVNRYAGGTNLDLLSYKKTITYSAVDGGSGGILANTNSFTFTASSTQGVLAGYYCLIDSEFMKITSVSGSTVTIGAAVNPAVGLTTGNGGRQAFGTGVPGTGTTHGGTGSCLVYELKNGNGQALEATTSGFGHTEIYDPRVSIRAVKPVQSTTSLHLEDKAGDLPKTASEPTNIIGDPYEEFENANPVRSGADYRCPTVGVSAYNRAGAQLKISPAAGHAAGDTTLTLTPAWSANSPWDLAPGDYIKV